MWRNNSRTGSNDAPLGKSRAWGNSPAGASTSSPQHVSSPAPSIPAETASQQPGERRRRSRWGTDNEKSGRNPALMTAITKDVDPKDLERYSVRFRLDEIAKKLREGNVVPPPDQREASPPPTYDPQGRRTNTREVRYRKKLEDERNYLVEQAMKIDPTFQPPPEYLIHKRSGRVQEKIYVPKKEFPEINFFGLIVGPRGNSLKKIQADTNTKVSIRGKGSVKEGKTRSDAYGNDDDEDQHCLITGDSEENVKACARLINRIIEDAASTPESANTHKRNQLRELAQLNGTLRDDENQACQNCGTLGHRKYDCPQQANFTANILCRTCGSKGHMAKDCKVNGGRGGPDSSNGDNASPGGGGAPQSAQFDTEYASLMAELGEAPRGGGESGSVSGHGTSTPLNSTSVSTSSRSVPPWRDPANWQGVQQQRPQQYQRYQGQQQYGGQQQYSGQSQQNSGSGYSYYPQSYTNAYSQHQQYQQPQAPAQ